MDGDLVYGSNIQELIKEFQFEHTSGQWRLFIYSSNVNLKAVSLHNGNKLPSISLVDAVHVTENFRVSCKTYAMKNTGAINVMAQSVQQCWLYCKADRLNSVALTLLLLTWRIWRAPNNAKK
jgi:hypothetical protein